MSFPRPSALRRGKLFYYAIKVGLKLPVLALAELVKLGLGVGPGKPGRHLSCIPENIPVVEFQKTVQLLDPGLHGHRNSSPRLSLGEYQILFHKIVQRQQFLAVEIVLGDADIRFADPGALPACEAHVGQSAVRAILITSAAVWPWMA